MIPKVINYCWFGGKEKPLLVKKCIKSWRKHCKGFAIKEWNESNIDIKEMPKFVRQAYELKKWAFVTDYIRLYVIYNFGGFYLDTDVFVLKSLEPLTKEKCYFGFNKCGQVDTGVGFGAEKGISIFADLLSQYENLDFTSNYREGDIGMDIVAPKLNSEVFYQKGLKPLFNVKQTICDYINIYPIEYFFPENTEEGFATTSNTYSIHYCSASWISGNKWSKLRLLFFRNRFYIFLRKLFRKLKFIGRKKNGTKF